MATTLVVATVRIQGAEPRSVSVIPRPAKVKIDEGEFVIQPSTRILASKETRNEGALLAEWLAPATGSKIGVNGAADQVQQANSISLRITDDTKHLGAEGYRLQVLNDRVVIEGSTPAGVFYGCQTLRQLLPADIESKEKLDDVAWTIPLVTIEDRPRFLWRGFMLDSGRCFQRLEWIKRYLDLMALYKMNRFHWHLTERVGWKIEIKKYPKLAQSQVFDTGLDRQKLPEGQTVREYYTQEEIRDVVAYATRRHIMVIPEIEMPGHSGTAIAMYPDMMHCYRKDGKWARRSQLLVGRIMCGGNDGTFEFIDGVLSEVAELFPSPWIHIGGDEPHVRVWGECERCQSRIKAEELEGVHGMYNYFMRRVEQIVLSKNKRMYGWEEIGRAGLSKSATIQSWHGLGPGHAAALRGQDVVMSPSSHCYLDSSPGSVTVARCYSFNPLPADLPADKAKHILGLEAPMWCDKWRSWQYRPRPGTLDRLDYQVYPRLIALAEVGWSPQKSREWDDFKVRLKVHGQRLDRLGVKYYRDGAVWGQ
jgi:hexosaminidase